MELLCGAQANAFGASHLPLGDHVHGFDAADKDARATEIFEPVGCLLIDEDGIYDPRQPNDRLLLGMKGTLSEMELSTFRQRS